jgi:stress response protein SCP2
MVVKQQLQQSLPSKLPIDVLVITISIHQGLQLVAKDRNFFGKKLSSDPYVQIHLLDQFYGKTNMQEKTTSPQWKNQTFTISLSDTSIIQQALRSSIVCSIWDYDAVSLHDCMGDVLVPLVDVVNYDAISSSNSSSGTSNNKFRKFYPVQNRPGNCNNATGELEISCSMVASRISDYLIPGNIHPIDTNHIMILFSWEEKESSLPNKNSKKKDDIDIDFSCVAISNVTGEIILKETIYFGNKCNRNRSIRYSRDDRNENIVGYEGISCQLDNIPSDIGALYLIASIVNETKTFGDIKSTRIQVNNSSNSQPICQFLPHEQQNIHHDVRNSTSIFLARLYRKNESPEQWLFGPIVHGHPTARDFGHLIPQMKSYSRDIMPVIKTIDVNEKIAVMRKNGIIRINDYYPLVSNNTSNTINDSNWLTLGLKWDIQNRADMDLDASVICLDEQLQVVDVISFNHLRSDDNAIIHGGDERDSDTKCENPEGDDLKDDEKIKFSLNQVNPKVQYMGIVTSSYSGKELDHIALTSCHLYDTTINRDVANYALTNCQSLKHHTAVMMACMFRPRMTNDNETLDTKNEWLLEIIAEPAQGRTAQDNIDDFQNYIQCHQNKMVSNLPPLPFPDIVVESEQEPFIDLSIVPPYLAHTIEDDLVVIPS